MGEARTAWLFCDTPFGASAGTSYMIESWGRELSRIGWRVRTFLPSGTWGEHRRTDEVVEFRTIRHVGYHNDYFAFFSSLAEIHRARHELPDVILVGTPARVGLLGMAMAARYSIPLVVVVATNTTGIAEHYNANRAIATMLTKLGVLLGCSATVRKALLRTSPYLRAPGLNLGQRVADHAVVAIQQGSARLVMFAESSVELYGKSIDPSRIVVIPSGIDPMPPSPTPENLHWRPGALRVLCVGRYSPEKRPATLIDAVAEVTRRGHDVQLALVGQGFLEQELRDQAARLGIADHVLVTGPYPRDDLQGVYASADVFAFGSTIDTQAFSLNEAANEALPLLLADPDVNPVAVGGQSAVMVEPTAEGFAEGLIELSDPELRARLGGEARRLAGQYTEAAQTLRLSDVLCDAAGLPHLRVAEPVSEPNVVTAE